MAKLSFPQRIRAAVKAAAAALTSPVRFPGSGSSGGGLSGLWNLLAGSQYDYEREAGDLWKNSIVLPCLKWLETNFPEAPLIVRRRKGKDNKYEPYPDHPLEDLIRNPNPFYSSDYLWAGTNLSLAVNGNAYWLKRRAPTGRVVQLWWIPHQLIRPAWPKDGSEFISHYDYTVNNTTKPIQPSEIVHFRDGVNPHDLRSGLGRLTAALREVCSENEAATYTAALFRNAGVPSVIIDPVEQDADIDEDEREKIKAIWSDNFTGDNRGTPMVSSRRLRITPFGFNPSEMVIDKVRQIPEERISAALGIPAVVVGLGAGLARSTFANYKEAREAAYESGIMPRQRLYAMQLDKQLLPDFENFVPRGVAKDRVGWDLSEVRALQDDVNSMYERLELACGGPFLTVNEARKTAGLIALDAPKTPSTDAPPEGEDAADGDATEENPYDQIRDPRPQVVTPVQSDPAKTA